MASVTDSVLKHDAFLRQVMSTGYQTFEASQSVPMSAAACMGTLPAWASVSAQG
jgi:hypothetical protein